jgi:hypothetical protein
MLLQPRLYGDSFDAILQLPKRNWYDPHLSLWDDASLFASRKCGLDGPTRQSIGVCQLSLSGPNLSDLLPNVTNEG